MIALVIVNGHVESSKHLKKNCHGDSCLIADCTKLRMLSTIAMHWNCKLILKFGFNDRQDAEKSFNSVIRYGDNDKC